jgi:hypothetical protein
MLLATTETDRAGEESVQLAPMCIRSRIKNSLKMSATRLYEQLLQLESFESQQAAIEDINELRACFEQVDQMTFHGDGNKISNTSKDTNAKKKTSSFVPLPGDQSSDDIEPLEVYTVYVHDKGSGYLYVHETPPTKKSAHEADRMTFYQAQPYVRNFGHNSRWHVGNYRSAEQAALAVAIATHHMISQPKVEQVMKKLIARGNIASAIRKVHKGRGGQ